MNIDMDLLNIFRRPKPQTRVEAVAHEIRKHSRALIEIDEQSRAFYRQDIGRWRRAHEAAADVENPRRADLYNVYADVVLNTQVEGCMRQIETAVMQRRFYIRSEKTAKELPEKTSIIFCPWFRDLMHHALDAEAWGNSLVELGNVVEMRGRRTIDSVHLIPREHVVPEYGLVLKDINDDLSMGIDYRNNPRLNRFLIDINADEPLGFLLKVAPEAISIKNMSGFWDSFGELFGIPVRWATTTSTDDSDKATIMSALRQMGAAAFGLFPEGTEIKFLETQRGDAFQVFDQRIARAQTNISKAILNQTMTIDDGSSLSQSETHLDIFNRVVRSRMAMIASMVNWQLLPKLQEMGLPFTDDDVFVWDEAVSYTPEQQLQIEQMILANYEVDPAYFKEKYNIEITGVKQQAAGLFATAELKKKKPGHSRTGSDVRAEVDEGHVAAETLRRIFEGEEIDFDETSMTFTDDELRKALLDGYGRRAITPEYGTPDFGMVENLRRNVYQFSVAKNHHQLRTLTDTLIDDEGRVRSFSEFQTEARKIDSRYNVDYLRTEYDTAIGAAETASEWASLEARGGDPMLRYVTVGDDRVRASHAALNGLQRPMSDPIWNTIYPPNGWNCRCLVRVVSGAATPQKLIRMPDDLPDMFKTNLAKAGLLFPRNHPYFNGISSKTFARALEYIPVENTYFDAKTPGGHVVEVSCLHRDHEQAQNVAATDILLGKGIVRKATLLPDIHKDDVAVKRRFYPAGELPPDPLKNADAVFDGHVFEIKQTTPNNMVRNINKAAQQARRVVVRLTTGGKNQNYRIRERATAAKRDNRLDELIVIFPDGEVERF